MAGIMKTALFLLAGAVIGAGAVALWASNKPNPDLIADAPRVERATDGRVALYITSEEQDHISLEMLEFLQGVQTVSYGIAEQDRTLIGDTASALSKGAGDPIGRSLRQKLPESFRQISKGLRSDFAELASKSESASFEDLNLQVSTITSRCVACHGTYSVVETGP